VGLARAAGRRAPARLTPVGAALAGVAAAFVAAYLLSGESLRPDETMRSFAKVLAAQLLFVPLINLLPGHAAARRLTTWLVACTVVEALVGLALYAVPRGLALRLLVALGPLGYPTDGSVLRYRPETDVLRAIGTAVDPNMLGALLMVVGAILVPQLVAARPYVPRVLAAVALAPIGLCLLLTESRGSWLGLASAVLFVAVLNRRLWPGLVAFAGVAALLPQTQRFTSHLVSGLYAQDRAAAMRIGEIQNALAIIAEHPWWGAGWNQAGKSIDLAFTFGVSNVFLTVAERSGVVATAVYAVALLTLAATLWPAVRASSADPADDGLLLGLAGALVATQVAGMLDHHFVRFPHLIALLWLVAALAVAAARAPAPFGAAAIGPTGSTRLTGPRRVAGTGAG
jgi:O-antigen ligase